MRSRRGGGMGRLTNRGESRQRKRTPLWVKAKSREPGAGEPGKRWRRRGPSWSWLPGTKYMGIPSIPGKSRR